MADTLHDHRIIIFEIHDHTIFKRKQIKVLIQIFDDINHLINTGAFVVEISSGVIQQNMKQSAAQMLQPAVFIIIGIGSEACFWKQWEILREKTVADLDDRNDIFLFGGAQAMNLMTTVGKNIPFL